MGEMRSLKPPELLIDLTKGEVVNPSEMFSILWKLIITLEPVFIVTEDVNGSLVEKLTFVNLGDRQKPIPLIVSEKIVFRSRDKSKKILFHKLKKNPVYFVNVNYNYLTLDPSISQYAKNSERAFYQYTVETRDHRWIRIIIYSDLSVVGNKISLLHEISHSHRDNNFVEQVNDLHNNLMASYEISRDEVLAGERERIPTANEVLYCPYDDVRESDFYPVPRDEFYEYHEVRADEEKSAWEFAFEYLDDLRLQGLDLEPELHDREVLEALIHHEDSFGLGSYEADLESCQGGDSKSKILGLYSIKMYELREYTRELRKTKDVGG